MRWIRALIWLSVCSAGFAIGMGLIWFALGDKFASTDVIEAGAFFFFVMLAIIIIGNWKKS